MVDCQRIPSKRKETQRFLLVREAVCSWQCLPPGILLPWISIFLTVLEGVGAFVSWCPGCARGTWPGVYRRYTIHCHDISFGENKWETREQTSHSWNGMDEVVACKMVLVVRCEADRMSAITMMSVLMLGSWRALQGCVGTVVLDLKHLETG